MELRQTFEDTGDLAILWVMVDDQINDKTLRYIDGLGLRERVHFAVDPGGRAVDRLRVRLENPEPIEAGVPHPTTYLVDAEGIVRLVDVRRDFHIWLDPSLVAETLAAIR